MQRRCRYEREVERVAMLSSRVDQPVVTLIICAYPVFRYGVPGMQDHTESTSLNVTSALNTKSTDLGSDDIARLKPKRQQRQQEEDDRSCQKLLLTP